MRALKLSQVMQSNSVVMSEALIRKIRTSGNCRELLRRVAESEERQYAQEIYRNLADWLANETDSILEQHYVDLGSRRAIQGVPMSQLFWAVSIAREHLWEYMQQECFHEEPVEFWGGVMLLRSLNRFFDHVLYFTLTGYEKASEEQSAAMSFLSQGRSA